MVTDTANNHGPTAATAHAQARLMLGVATIALRDGAIFRDTTMRNDGVRFFKYWRHGLITSGCYAYGFGLLCPLGRHWCMLLGLGLNVGLGQQGALGPRMGPRGNFGQTSGH